VEQTGADVIICRKISVKHIHDIRVNVKQEKHMVLSLSVKSDDPIKVKRSEIVTEANYY
jgi:hypothetical protein